MRQVTKQGLLTIVAAGGVLAMSGAGTALADSGAQGGAEGSPGVLSGNSVQVPIDVPVNLCGNSVSVIGLLNPTFGNTCHNGGESVTPPPEKPSPEPPKPGQSTPEAPPEHPSTPDKPATPDRPDTPAQPPAPEQPGERTVPEETPAPEQEEERAVPASYESPQLAETGSGSQMAVVAPLGGALLLGGYVLYRRSRAVAR
ncbi:chaplin [Streptomyces xiaopingdaonensis]|uniref:chaplin n=1 Tax=Streptomyces xiaopingdaonensis TaxID=1565415 RepID=UPI0002FDD089|nr:chaplin [Streptomyces xiaopingdaonensis]